MEVAYEEQGPELIFRHWVTYEISQFKDDIMAMMDVNQWCGEMFGDLGIKWGYERTRNVPAINGSVKYTMRNPPSVKYSWRFRDKEDAMLFKLTWGGA